MTKLSFWAKHHPANARIIIVLLHVLLNILAVYAGYTLLQLGLAIPAALVYIIALLFFTAVCIYPAYKQGSGRFNKKQLYAIRKCCDFALGACSFIMVCFAANNYFKGDISFISFAAASVKTKGGEKPNAEAILASLAYRDKSTLTRSEKRILKNEFRHQLKLYVKAKLTKDDEAGLKAFFIILSIIGAVGLTFLLAGLACSISCNGSEAAAVLVGIIGFAAIVLLLLVVIRKIKNHKKKTTTAPEEVHQPQQ